MPVLGLGLGTQHMSRVLLDSDVAAFADESGATDLAGQNALVKYVKGEGLYNNFVIYPMKSAQNAGSGATVYSLGGLTTNNATLVNSPSWASTGITFDGVNQYGTIADFLGSQTLTTFSRVIPNAAVASFAAICSQYEVGTDSRSWATLQVGAQRAVRLLRSSDGTSTNSEGYSGTTNFISTDTCVVSQWIDGSGRSAWIDKASESLSLSTGSAQTSRLDSPANITIAALLSSGSPIQTWHGEQSAMCLVGGTLTTAQREQITDLINAL